VRLLSSHQTAVMPVDFLCHNGKERINAAIWRTVFT
jgi:hypothetical protein